MQTQNPFGTDGLRGKVGQEPMTPGFMMKLGWAIGRAFASPSGCKVVIGKDTRISGYMFESALEAGLSAAGAFAVLLGPLPTPGVACIVRKEKADLGIVITASHNPYYDNGIKLFNAAGSKLSHESESLVLEWLSKPMEVVPSATLGRASREVRAADIYVDHCLGFAVNLDLSGMKMVLDCANGAAYGVAPAVYQRLGCELTVIGGHPDGLNINRKVGSMEPEQLQRVALAQGADIGLAVDGDGDRLLMVDAKGETVDGDELLAIIAYHRQDTVGINGVVGTEMSSLALELTLAKRGIAFKRTQVGDRNVFRVMNELGWQLGGENSGHIICLDKANTSDAIISSLEVMQVLKSRKEELHEARKIVVEAPRIVVNVPYNGVCDLENEDLRSLLSDCRKSLEKSGRVVVRKSGTEPVIRVMVEANLMERCNYWSERIITCINDVNK